MLKWRSGRDVGGGSGYRGREGTKGGVGWRNGGERGCERWKGEDWGGSLGLDGEVWGMGVWVEGVWVEGVWREGPGEGWGGGVWVGGFVHEGDAGGGGMEVGGGGNEYDE